MFLRYVFLSSVLLSCICEFAVSDVSAGNATDFSYLEEDVVVSFYSLQNDTALDTRAKPTSASPATSQRLPRFPCSCQRLTCGCCAGMNIVTLSYNQRACMNFTYDPTEFKLTTNMLMNDKSVYKREVSGRNPAPICVPLPIPFIKIRFDMCAKFFNIFTPGRNIHLCMDFEARIQRRQVVVLHFDCIRMGANGLVMVKPEDGGGLPAGVGATEDYDEVGEDVTTSATPGGGGGGGGGEGGGGATQGGGDTEPPIDEDYDEVMLDKNRNKTIKGTKKPPKIELVGLKVHPNPNSQIPRP